MGVQALSAVGRCQTFSVAADGYGRGEACAVLLLQRLSSQHDASAVAIVQVRILDHQVSSEALDSAAYVSELMRQSLSTRRRDQRLVSQHLLRNESNQL